MRAELTFADRVVPLETGQITIGRSPDNDVVLSDDRVSRHHAILRLEREGLTVVDLNSNNGTRVGERRLRGAGARAGDGDQLDFGGVLATVRIADTQAGPTRPASPDITPRQRPPAHDARTEPPGDPVDGHRDRAAAPRRLSQLGLASGMASIVRHSRNRSRVAIAIAGIAVLLAAATAAAAVTGVFSGAAPSTAEIAREVAPATVLVWGYRTSPNKVDSNGSGWVLDAARGLIVTNDHVAEGDDSLEIAAGTRPGAPADADRRPAALLGGDPCEDIAVLHVADTAGLQTLPMGRQSSLSAGDPVVALGFPIIAARQQIADFDRAALIVTSGTVSSPRTQYTGSADEADLTDVVQTDAPINHGNSGGPLVDAHGHLVGMNTATFFEQTPGDVSGENYAIGVDRIRALVGRLVHGSIDSIGWELDPGVVTDDQQQGASSLPNGIALEGAVKGSPAGHLSIQYYDPGDVPPFSLDNAPPTILESIGGTQLADAKSSYCQAVSALPGGQGTVTVGVPADDAGQITYDSQSFQVRFPR